ncbi:MAG: hypothetical protein WA192_02425 [Candidatus Acidiferrales bacterium]
MKEEKNALLREVQQVGFDPWDFEWSEETLKGNLRRTEVNPWSETRS